MDEPSEAALVFAGRGDGLDLARRYTAHLASTGVDRGLIGPREVPRLWERHVLNCAVVASLVPVGARVVDVGSGAGLPGLPLAIARPDLHVVLLEPLQRRVTWLREVVDDLGLAVEVVRGRAEDAARPGPTFLPPAGVVTARAVATLDRLARWCLPLVAPGGVLLALKGSSAAQELAASRPVLTRAGVLESEIVTVGDGLVAVPTTVVRVTVGAARGTGRRSDRGALRRRGQA